MNVWRSN
jgi:hypothetical protein